MISEALLTLPQILAKMDIALVDEIKAQSRKSGTHVAVNGTFVAEQSQQYLYTFTLLDPWEPQDDTPFKVKFGSAQEIQGVIVTSTGTTITIATEEPLPPEALDRISLVDDPTQLLERLRDALKSNEEGSSRLGSKCFGLLPFTTGKRQSPVAFGGKFKPDNSQERAIQLALGSEVTYIVGPPGTGKTSTLAAIAFAHLIEGHTVLIAAHTNIAVDNAIMRLVDICKGANASNELRDGHIIRYGNPQLEARLKSEYSEVHLPTVVKHRVGDLSQRRKELQSYLDQVSAQLTTMNQEKTSLAEQWNLDRQSLVAHRDAHKNELILLQAREQQRISALDAQLQDLFHQLTQTQQHANIIRQRLAQIVAQQVQQQTVRSEHFTHINVYHALCTLEIARQVLASLPPPKRRLHAGEFRVGLVTPYRKQAELLQHLILDAGLKDSVRAGTVHRFQGLEAEVIIFDTVESPPLSPPEFTSGQWGSKAMRLVNVAVTRAQHKLIVLANSQYIQTNFYENDMLRLAVQEAQKADVIKSRDVLSILSPPPSNIGRSPLQNHGYKKEGKDTPPATSYIYEPEFLDDRTFYERFLQDVQSAEKQVVIFSPFLSLHRAKQIAPLLSERCRMGVRITVITSTLKPTDGEVATLLKKAGVELRTASGMHEKLVFIDEKIVYTGSLNVLSHGGTTEFIERVKSPKFAKKLRQFKNIDAVVEAPLQWGPSVMVFRHELPKTTTNCKKCGKPLTPIVGGYGAFYGCTDYRNSGCDYTEEVSESHLNGIQRIVNMRCSRCGERTRVKTNRKDAWLVCAAPISCGYGQRIAYSK